eukprot:GDKJ01010660.1.p1 GENE.GDKJ01010660.1~~GDKJ01010660.1.p1  ORF type:complete len:557 (+),score=104.05 GDKJ01010660.1:67-1737(+)
MTSRKVGYMYHPDVGTFFFGEGHPMKPQRAKMVHSLIMAYDVYRKLDSFEPSPASKQDLEMFHSKDYVTYLRSALPGVFDDPIERARHFVGVSEDCPLFTDVYSHQSLCVGATMDAATILNDGRHDVTVNWLGGLHHAKRDASSGFCYFNDIVLGILELLKCHARVLYVDIDIHHGDGVEEAFLQTNRVFTLSFHFHDGIFFPESGALDDSGPQGEGRGYTLNVPLDQGCSDQSFMYVFKPIFSAVFDRYKPGAIVLQCGADSLGGDILGRWNLSSKGHAEAVKLVLDRGVPTMLLGGGGYTIRNTTRCWGYETALAAGMEKEIPSHVPCNPFSSYWMDSGKDDIPMTTTHVESRSDIKDMNTNATLQVLLTRALMKLKDMEIAPSLQTGIMVPPRKGFLISCGKGTVDMTSTLLEDEEGDGGGNGNEGMEEEKRKKEEEKSEIRKKNTSLKGDDSYFHQAKEILSQFSLFEDFENEFNAVYEADSDNDDDSLLDSKTNRRRVLTAIARKRLKTSVNLSGVDDGEDRISVRRSRWASKKNPYSGITSLCSWDGNMK